MNNTILPHLNPTDYLHQSEQFWKNYRKLLRKKIIDEELKLIDKTKDNIIKMAKINGIKATARYFNISPSTVRYYLKNK